MKCQYKKKVSEKIAQLGHLTTDYQALRALKKIFADKSHYSIGIIIVNFVDATKFFLNSFNL